MMNQISETDNACVNIERNKNKKIILITVTVLALIIGGTYFHNEMKYVSTDDAYVETTTVQVVPKVSGELVRVFVEDNQKVNKGDLLAKIEDSDYKIKAAQANAKYEQALQNQKNAKANHKAMITQIAATKADYERYKALYDDGAVSKQELDRAESTYEKSKADLKNADEALLTKTGKSVADAQIAELKALKEQAELFLPYTNIYAPQNGTIAAEKASEGMHVQPGTPLLTIVPDDVWIVANFKENQLEYMKAGQDVNIKIDAFGHKKFIGKVDSIQRASGAKSSMFPPENAVGSFVKIVQRVPVKIVFTNLAENEAQSVIPGMSAVPRVKVK